MQLMNAHHKTTCAIPWCGRINTLPWATSHSIQGVHIAIPARHVYLEQSVVSIVDKGNIFEPANPVWNGLHKESCYLQATSAASAACDGTGPMKTYDRAVTVTKQCITAQQSAAKRCLCCDITYHRHKCTKHSLDHNERYIWGTCKLQQQQVSRRITYQHHSQGHNGCDGLACLGVCDDGPHQQSD